MHRSVRTLLSRRLSFEKKVLEYMEFRGHLSRRWGGNGLIWKGQGEKIDCLLTGLFAHNRRGYRTPSASYPSRKPAQFIRNARPRIEKERERTHRLFALFCLVPFVEKFLFFSCSD